MSGCVGPPLPVELVCPLCKDLADEAVMLPCCAAALCDQCAKKRILEEKGKCHMCKDTVDPENLIPYRLLRDKVDKFLSISGYKRRQMASSTISKPASSRSPRGTSPPTPPPLPPPADTNRPPPRVPCYPPPRTPALRTSSGHLRQSHPQQPHSNQYSHKEAYYDDRHRQQYSRPVGWDRDYRADHRPYISPSDDPLAAFQAAMAKMDYEKERSRARSYYSPPRAYRKHSRPHRRERLESDIPPETREEREQRLEFERKLRKRAQREEDEVFWETKESHCDEKFRKRGREERAALVKAGELKVIGGEAVVEEGSWEEQEKFDKMDENGSKEVHQGDSTPSLSPETIDNCDKEGKERNGEEDSLEDDLRKDIVKEGEPAGETASRELCVKSGDTEADDSSSEDSVKEEEEPKKVVRSRSPYEEKSVGGEIDQDQEQCRFSTDDQVKVAENSDSKSVEVDEDSAQGQERSSTKDCSAMRREFKTEKLERKDLMAPSSELDEGETMKGEKHFSEDERSDGEEVEEKKRKRVKKQEKKERKLQAEYEKNIKRSKAKKDKKAEKRAKKEKSKKEKKVKKKKRKCKDSTPSESDLDGGGELFESKKKKKAKKADKAPNVTAPLDLSQLRTMMRENLITDKELRKLMKATVKSEKEKKVTFKISEFSRNSGQELMKVLFSKKSSSNKKREASSSSPESERKKWKNKEMGNKADTKDEELLSDLSGEEKKRSKSKEKKAKRGRKERNHSRERIKEEGSEVSLARSRERYVDVDARRKQDEEERQHKSKLNTMKKRRREDEGGEDEMGDKKESKKKKRKRSHSEERDRGEVVLEKEEGHQRAKREERVCKRKDDGMLEVKVENKKPVGRLLEERLVNDERLGKKLEERLLMKEEKQDMKERLGPMPSRASKRSW